MESFVPVNRPASGTLIQQLHQLKKLAPLAAIKDPGATEVAIEVNAAEVLQYDHIDDYKILEKDLSAAAATTLKNLEQGRKYDKVSVLGVYWHASIRKPDYLASHADDLLRVFSDKYNYAVTTLVLDKKTAYKDLNWNLASIGHHLGSTEENNLFILYYGGHGGFDGNDGKARLWQSNTNDASESVDWHKLQEQLRGFDFDILFLFDCCYAMAMPTEGMAWPKRCEIVAAAGERERASAKAETSFTAALTKLLERDVEINNWTNAWRLGTVMRSRDYTSTLRSTPQYAKLAKGVGSTISLIPLSPKLGLPPSSNSSSMSSRTLTETLTCSDARILFSIKTVNLPKAEEFEHMLSLLPSSVIGLEVGVHSQKLLDGLGLFKSNSGLSLLSVPVWFWYAMDSNPAYKYIDLVRSGNYLEEHRLAKQEVTTSRYCTRGVQTDKVEELIPSDPVDIVRTRRNERYYNEIGAGLQQAILRSTEPRTITVPWHSPRKPIFSKENDRFERRIEKETAGISVEKIERDIDAYSYRNMSMDTRMNRKHRGIFTVA